MAENYGYGGHRNLRHEKITKIVYIFLANLDIEFPKHRFF